MSITIPDSHRHLVEQPIVATLATITPHNGKVISHQGLANRQSNPLSRAGYNHDSFHLLVTS